jgi:Transposase zinc-binding domain
MYHARVLAASHSIYGCVVTEGALLYTDCPKNSLPPRLQGQPARPGVPHRAVVRRVQVWLLLWPPMNRDPSRTVLYKVVTGHLATFLASLDADPDAKGLPAYMQREFYDYVQCGILAHGFLQPGCDTCQKELLPFSCKRRWFCPSCAGRRMPMTAVHLVECVGPQGMMRQWVVAVPMPLRYGMASSQDLTRDSPYDHSLSHPERHLQPAQYRALPWLRGVSTGLPRRAGRMGGAAARGSRCRGGAAPVGRSWEAGAKRPFEFPIRIRPCCR